MTARMDPGRRWQNCRVHTDSDRERLRQTFDAAAARYDRVRPEYPEALFDDLVALAGLRSGDELLEVGCATGKATRPLARRGFRITCVELGAELAAVARQNLAGFEVEVVRASFEEWQPPHPFGLVYAATAWHWIDPGVRYQLAVIAVDEGKPEEARQILESLVKESPQFTEAHVSLSLVYYRLKRPADGKHEQEIAQKLTDAEQAKQPGVKAQ